jgi:hypothetical protein
MHGSIVGEEPPLKRKKALLLSLKFWGTRKGLADEEVDIGLKGYDSYHKTLLKRYIY